jgi:hypothetical protein
MLFDTFGRHIQVPAARPAGLRQSLVSGCAANSKLTSLPLIDVDYIMLAPTYGSGSAIRAAEITRGEARSVWLRT